MSTVPDPQSRPRSLRQRFGDVTVFAKIILGLATAALVALAVGAVGIVGARTMVAAADEMYGQDVRGTALLGEMKYQYAATRLHASSASLATDDAGRAHFTQERMAALEQFDASAEAYQALDLAPEQAETIATVRGAVEEFGGLVDQVSALYMTGRAEEATVMRTEQVDPLTTTINDGIEALIAAQDAASLAARDAAGSAGNLVAVLTVVITVSGVLLTFAVGLVVAMRVRTGLRRVQGVAANLAAGDLTVTADMDARDEIGETAGALDSAIENLRGLVAGVADSASRVAAASQRLADSSGQVAASADDASAQAGAAAAASEQVSQNVQTVAAGAEQMGASIREIAQNANAAAKVAGQATEVAASTNETITQLGTSSQEIGEVVKVITQIAEQTNLLALNATIEAARAGEAGKGFAVVASEVKELAQESAKAAEDITRRIEAIQGDTGGAVNAIGQISEVIARINDYQLTIASAVEEQTATTNEMSRGITEAATGTGEITGTITAMSASATRSSAGVGAIGAEVETLASMADELRDRVDRFTLAR